MDFFDAVAKRASYRGSFLNQEIPETEIRKIVSAGLCAPSGYNYQTTSVVIVRERELREKIAALLPTPATKTAPVILVAVSECRINEAEGAAHFDFETEDYAACVENIMLAITAMGYAGVWMDGMTRMDQKDEMIRELLGVPVGKTVRSIIPFGIPEKEAVQKAKKPFEERVIWDHY